MDRKPMKLLRWMKHNDSLLEYLDVLHVIATLLSYDIKYQRWPYSSTGDKDDVGFGWNIELYRSEELQFAMVLNYRDKKLQRIYLAEGEIRTEYLKSKKLSIEEIKNLFLQML